MKLLFIAPLPEPTTGQAVACKVLADDLSRVHELKLINLSKGGFRQGLSSLRRVAAVLRLAVSVRRLQRDADVIYLTVSQSRAGNLRDILFYVLCRGKLSRMVVHLHGGAGLRVLFRNHALIRRLNAVFLSRLGGVVVEGATQACIFDGLVQRDRVHIVPNFAEDYLFATPASVESRFEQGGRFKLLFLSNLLPGKGHWELLDALELLSPEVRRCVAVDFAGGFESDADRDRFLRRIEGMSCVRYHGTVSGERKRALFQSAHAFCLPTYYAYEGQPLSILEAYASGCAVITTMHSGIGDVFRPGINGDAVTMRSPQNLASTLNAALGDRKRMLRMALTNLEIARTEYRTSVYASRVHRILHEASRCRPLSESPGIAMSVQP